MIITEKEYQIAPKGMHVGTLYSLVDLGTQIMEYQGEVKVRRRIYMTFELPEDLMEDGRPFSIGKEYTLSTNENATLTEHLTTWRDIKNVKGFDLKSLLGESANLSIVYAESAKGRTYAKIISLGQLMNSQKLPAIHNDLVYFSMNQFDESVYQKLPEWMKGRIAESKEFRELGDKPTDDGLPGYVTDEIGY